MAQFCLAWLREKERWEREKREEGERGREEKYVEVSLWSLVLAVDGGVIGLKPGEGRMKRDRPSFTLSLFFSTKSPRAFLEFLKKRGKCVWMVVIVARCLCVCPCFEMSPKLRPHFEIF